MSEKGNRRAAIVFFGMALTGAALVLIANVPTAKKKRTRFWLQYGTLKEDLRGPSGKVYQAGTRVARQVSIKEKPARSALSKPFSLTLQINGVPEKSLFQCTGGGAIAESYVNVDGDWIEIDYPYEDTVIVNNATDERDLKSSDFRPVNASNKKVSSANLDKLNKVYRDFSAISSHSDIKGIDKIVVLAISNLYLKIKKPGTTQAKVDHLVAEINALIARYHKIGHFTVSKRSRTSTQKTDNNNLDTREATISTANKHKFRKIRLSQASYQYNSEGLPVSEKLLQKGSIIKISNGIYLIKGRSFYQIASNHYVPVNNTYQ